MDRKENLLKKANALPLKPGVYIMKNADGRVIYVGKSKAIHNRVSSYFQRGARHNLKTARMVASVFDFDCILTDTEIEALALENKLIKLYAPRYNIRLKDGKSYPYIRLEKEKNQFPRLSVTRQRKKDGANYYGPYSGTRTAHGITETVRRVFLLPECKHRFPEDTGRIKPCIYLQMGQCTAPCVSMPDEKELADLKEQIGAFLNGNMGQTKKILREQMEACAEDLRFESAAILRDRLRALERLADRQKVVGDPGDEFDVISVYEDDQNACMCILYVRDGNLLDSEFIEIGPEMILDEDAVSALLTELYIRREYMPAQVLVDYPLEKEELDELDAFFCSIGKKTAFRVPVRGKKKQLCALAAENAAEHVAESSRKSDRDLRGLTRLAALTGSETLPERIEAVDISNFGNEEITAGFVCFENGKPLKSGYRLYKMRDVAFQDDYASMREAVLRRVRHAGDDPLPDLLLLDGGKGHVGTVKKALKEIGCDLPVLGMVKDEHHKTRALTDGTGEISIAGEQAVFVMIYKIQEEVHRFAYRAASGGKRKSLKRSSLEEIPGIGPKKARILLGIPGGLNAVKNASYEELRMIKGLTAADARTVRRFFHPEEE